VETRKILFEWLTEQNPFLEGRPPYFLLLDGGRVIGMHGHMPLLFNIKGSTQLGYLAHDDLLSADYRGKGLGKVMLANVASLAPSFAGALWFNEPNHKMYSKSGWTDVENFIAQVKIYDPRVFLKNRIVNKTILNVASAIGRTAFTLRDIARSRHYKNSFSVEKVKRYDEKFDKLFNSVAPHLGIAVQRNHHYLNWKYCDKPFSAYIRYAALDNKRELVGYIVSKIATGSDGPEGIILDVLVMPDRMEAFSFLINKALDDFETMKANCVKIMCSFGPARAVLSNLGFLQARKADYFMISNYQGLPNKLPFNDISSWYLTYADADGDAWSVDTAHSQ
jgi:GNAT superfamily N-acetyltransferase